MSDLIKRDEAVDAIYHHFPQTSRYEAWLALHEVSSVNIECKTGKWLCSDDLYETAVCSCCGWDTTEPWQHIKSWFEFCPHCGAYMRGNEDE